MPPPTSAQNEILRQLAEIQRSVGAVTAEVSALREDMRDESHNSREYRESVDGKMSNALTRIAKLEDKITVVTETLEGTLKPLAEGVNNQKQRVLGFISAWSIILAAAGGLSWLIFGGGLQQIFDFVLALNRGR